MELYASALWHLQQEVELSVLAESLHSSAPLRPEGLVAMASVMNLAKDHESAVKFLQRAIKVRKGLLGLSLVCVCTTEERQRMVKAWGTLSGGREVT